MSFHNYAIWSKEQIFYSVNYVITNYGRAMWFGGGTISMFWLMTENQGISLMGNLPSIHGITIIGSSFFSDSSSSIFNCRCCNAVLTYSTGHIATVVVPSIVLTIVVMYSGGLRYILIADGCSNHINLITVFMHYLQCPCMSNKAKASLSYLIMLPTHYNVQ